MESPVRTTSTEVEETYYGKSVIKAPHWRWYIINYFFLAALTGGSLTIATLADLFSGNRSLVRVARYLSFVTLAPCPPLLILDLGRPDRFLNMLRIVKLRSPMSLGSWALSFHGLFCSLQAALQLLGDITHRDLLVRERRLLGAASLPFSIFVSGYTGVLLAATNVPLWARNYLLLGPTFIASAFSGSLAALSLLLGLTGDEGERTAKSMARAESLCLATELALIIGGLLRLGTLGKPLSSGRWGRIFWPVTFFGGILVPLALQLSGPVQGNAGSRRRRNLGGLLVITGGYGLRMLMIFAGKESANRPQDYFDYTRRNPG